MNHNQQINQLLPLVKKMFSRLEVQNDPVDLIPLRGGNNRVYKVVVGKKEFVLKYYFKSDTDKRDRFLAEKLFGEYARQIKIRQVPDPILWDEKNSLALFEYIQGRKLKKGEVVKEHIAQAFEFIEDINDPEFEVMRNQFLNASDACFSIEDYINAVERRITALNNIEIVDEIGREAEKFIQVRFIPQWETIAKSLNNFPGKTKRIDRNQQIISPSDFGFHNAIHTKDKQLKFFDFEYAGWDDPVKMVCDFFCQPEIPVPDIHLEYFIAGMIRILNPSYDFQGKVKLLMPLHRLKWCCIMMNDFLRKDAKRKQFAFSYEDRREEQLNKTIGYADLHWT